MYFRLDKCSLVEHKTFFKNIKIFILTPNLNSSVNSSVFFWEKKKLLVSLFYPDSLLYSKYSFLFFWCVKLLAHYIAWGVCGMSHPLPVVIGKSWCSMRSDYVEYASVISGVCMCLKDAVTSKLPSCEETLSHAHAIFQWNAG